MTSSLLCKTALAVLPLVEDRRSGYTRPGTESVYLTHDMSSWTKTQPSQAAQPGIAADRFAHEIGTFLKVISGAHAAAECQAVIRL